MAPLIDAPDATPSPPSSYAIPHYSSVMSSRGAVGSTDYPYDRFDTSSIESDMHLDASHDPPRRTLVPGVYVPTLAFFDPATESLDLAATAAHALRLAAAGVAGLATQGSNGEAVHLSRRERSLVTRATRDALDAGGHAYMPVIVGCGAQSTRECVELCREARDAGGDYALVLPPSYYASLHAAGGRTVLEFFRDVADASPVPLLIYNFPAAAGGIDLTSDQIIELAKHPNVAGCKLTCGNTGKLNRIAAATRAATAADPGSGFMCLGGSADFLLQTLVGGGSGTIAGYANVAPKACVQLARLVDAGDLAAARKLQAVVARGDWAAIRGGIVGTKSAMLSHFGYGGYARKPLPRPNKEEAGRWREAFEETVALERSL